MKKIKEDIGITASADILHPFRFSKDGKSTPYISPHLHMIAFGWINGQKVKEVYEEHGIVIKNIRPIETKKIFPLAKYLLTHAGVQENTHLQTTTKEFQDGSTTRRD